MQNNLLRFGVSTFIISIVIMLVGVSINDKLDRMLETRTSFEQTISAELADGIQEARAIYSDVNESLKSNLEFQLFQINAFDKLEISCLARNMYFEARGQPTEGLFAVAHVTYNRVKADEFPNTFCGVVEQANYHNMQGRMIVSLNHCQFSWYCDGIPDVVGNREMYEKIYELAREYYIYRDYNVDFTEGSLYYHNTTVNPGWSTGFQKIAQIGDHIFYRP